MEVSPSSVQGGTGTGGTGAGIGNTIAQPLEVPMCSCSSSLTGTLEMLIFELELEPDTVHVLEFDFSSSAAEGSTTNTVEGYLQVYIMPFGEIPHSNNRELEESLATNEQSARIEFTPDSEIIWLVIRRVGEDAGNVYLDNVVFYRQVVADGGETSESNNPFRFNGMYWDAHTQTYYTPMRRLNPRTGRWTSPDPFWGIHNMQGSSAAIAQSANLFMFVMHNPVRFTDPTGLFAALTQPLMVKSPILQRVNEALTASSTPVPTRTVTPDGGGSIVLSPAEIASGITTIEIGGVTFRDMSAPVNAMLTNHANEARAQRRGVPAGLPFGFNASSIRLADSIAGYLWILDNFAEGRRFDFKHYRSWEDQFPDTPFHGVDDLFVVNGVLMGSADLGNLHFGYVTSALGVPTATQLMGAGVMHATDHGGLPIENIRHFGDSPRCRYFTDMGRHWYRHGRFR